LAIPLEQFVQQLTHSGLMSAAEVASFQQSLPADRRPKDAETLARELVQANRLTKYQASAVYQGKTKGLVFGEYVVLDKLGQGGMGVVLKAQHRRMKRVVAVKMIAGAALKSPDAVKRFYREVEAAARLDHPNIVTAHDASEHEGVHYLVMQFVEGKDLAAIVKERGPLPVAQAVDCVLQAARGLEYAHAQGIVHRDIKPGNLLLDTAGTVKILDMGLARVAGLEGDPHAEKLTQSGQVMGSVDYMAPEQALDTHTADARADIYSLGCTLYRLLTAEAPYKGESLAKILIGHQLSPIPSLCKARSDVPPQLDAIYQKMVAKRPEDRQQSMAEVVAELEACVGQRSGAAQALAERTSTNDGLQSALSFLQEPPGGTGARLAKKNLRAAVEQTLDQQPGADTSRQLALHGNVLRPKKRWGAVVAGTVLVVAVALGAVIITIRHPDGKRTVVRVPEGSAVTVSKQGAVEVAVTREEPAPAFQGGFRPELAAQPPLHDDKARLNTPQHGRPARKKGAIDLLPWIDLQKDGVIGTWRRTADGIAVEQPEGVSVLRLPYLPPAEYDYEIEFTPQGGGLNVNQYLSAEGCSFAWKLNSHGRTPPLYGFELLDGKFAKDLPEAAIQKPKKLESGKRYVSKVEVRRGSLRALVDGEEYVKWSGDTRRFSMEPLATLSEDGWIGVGSYKRAVVFHRIEVREVTGQGKFTGDAAKAGTVDDAFLQEVSALPVEERGPRVVAKLKELNPGYDPTGDGAVWSTHPRGECELAIRIDKVSDISPLRALPRLFQLHLRNTGEERSPLADLSPLSGLRLKYLVCTNTNVTDLSPLAGMPLEYLNISGSQVSDLSVLRGMPLQELLCKRTPVSDISPLRGMPLVLLVCDSTRITDLSPLQGAPLKKLRFDFDRKRDTEILRSLKALEEINNWPSANFWKQVDAGQVPSPKP
jgi:serine/threonine protein kinase